jgi:poly-gamma-glutamate system protein
MTDRGPTATLAREGSRPRIRGNWPVAWLALVGALSVAIWLLVEWTSQSPTHPRYAEMLLAARSVQSASRVLYAAKQARGLLPPPTADPNRTGMIGFEYTPITTTIGDLGSKRTTTNPDFAAALVRVIASLDLKPGAPVVIILSGSFVGGDVATIAAVEALGLRPLAVASVGASMWGATNPEFNLVDMLALLHSDGVLHSLPIAAVLGGEGAIASGIDAENVGLLRASATRAGIPLVEQPSFPALVDDLVRRITLSAGGRPAALINVGGALIGLGSCRESFTFPPGLTTGTVTCTAGESGLVMRLAASDLPVLHVLNIRELAIEWGLPFDPIPLPAPGNNPMVYGAHPRT